MLRMYVNYFKTLLGSKKGQGMVEYGLIIGIVAVALIVGLGLMKDQLATVFSNITTALTPKSTTPTGG